MAHLFSFIQSQTEISAQRHVNNAASRVPKISGVVIKATFIPCFTEAAAAAVLSHLILGFPWTVGFMLGFVLAAVSPAVIIPSLMSLSERGYGVAKGIPTLVIAACSADDVVAIRKGLTQL